MPPPFFINRMYPFRHNPGIHCNAVLDVQRTVTAPTEPVSLEDAKAYLKVGYDTDDALIERLIVGAREWVERRCGISILPATVVALLQVMNRQELPYGPVTDDPVVTTPTGDAVATSLYTFSGLDFPRLLACGTFQVAYAAGYGANLPDDLREAILARIAASYEHRGDELDESNVDYSRIAKQKSNLFRRTIGF
jgi:hypothetical protein